jgi:hypothetical protein
VFELKTHSISVADPQFPKHLAKCEDFVFFLPFSCILYISFFSHYSHHPVSLPPFHPIPYTKHTIPYTKHTIPYTKHTIPYTKHTIPYTKHNITYTKHTITYTKHTITYTKHTITYTKRTIPYTKHTIPSIPFTFISQCLFINSR